MFLLFNYFFEALSTFKLYKENMRTISIINEELLSFHDNFSVETIHYALQIIFTFSTLTKIFRCSSKDNYDNYELHETRIFIFNGKGLAI